MVKITQDQIQLTGTPLDMLDSARLITTRLAAPYFVSFPTAGNAQIVLNLAAGNVGIVTTVQMSLDGGAASFDARLRVYVDQEGSPSIDVDLGTLFVSHLDSHLSTVAGTGRLFGTDHVQVGIVGDNSTTMFTESDTQVSYQLQFPIPYSDGIRIEIFTPADVTPASPGWLFCSVFRRENIVSNYRLRSRGVTRVAAAAAAANPAANDVAMFDITATKGSAVWLSAAVFGATTYRYLERPWFWFVNGETVSPSVLFTGGEEFGATGWYFCANARAQTPAFLLGASNNTNLTAVFGVDLLKMHGGIPFDTQLRLVWSNKPAPYASDTDHKFGWCVLFYEDVTA